MFTQILTYLKIVYIFKIIELQHPMTPIPMYEELYIDFV